MKGSNTLCHNIYAIFHRALTWRFRSPRSARLVARSPRGPATVAPRGPRCPRKGAARGPTERRERGPRPKRSTKARPAIKAQSMKRIQNITLGLTKALERGPRFKQPPRARPATQEENNSAARGPRGPRKSTARGPPMQRKCGPRPAGTTHFV